jgi:hypothetical protein
MSAANAMKIHAPADASTTANVTDCTDRELLAACLRKDDCAWRELHRRYDGPLRGTAYKVLGQSLADRLPSDWRNDVMGDFWLKLIERDMAHLRSFDWDKGTALYKWFARLVWQCAVDYASMILDQPDFAPVEDAHEVADDGGVLASGREPLRGSLSAHVRRFNAKLAEEAKEEERERVRQARKRRRAASTRGSICEVAHV